MRNKDLAIVEEKIELAFCDVIETKTYVEISLVSLFFMFIAFFTEKSFIVYLAKNKLIGFIIISIIVLLFFFIVYLLLYIIKSKNSWDDLSKDKKNLNRDWTTEDD